MSKMDSMLPWPLQEVEQTNFCEKCGKLSVPAETESLQENMLKRFKTKESLMFNSKQLNCQPGNKLTTELTKNWWVLMLKLKT